MRAHVVSELGGVDQLELKEVNDPQPGPGELSIAVEAVGLNFPDLLTIAGLYQVRPELPFSPGVEAAGTVAAVGDGVEEFEVGQRVFGSAMHGAMAERFVVPAMGAFHLPDSITAEQGCVLPIAYGTSYHALIDRAKLQAGETLLITGASGGVGSSAIQIGKALGARVIAAVGSDEKAEVARGMGADETINYTTGSLKDEAKALTGGHGADVIYDTVGGDTFLECMRCINWEGRMLVVGFTSGDIPKAPTNLALLKGMSIVGVFWGAFQMRAPDKNRANFDRILEWVADGTTPPHISATYAFEDARTALTAISNRTVTGKVVLTV